MNFRLHLARRWIHDLDAALERDEKRVHASEGLRLTEGRVLVLALQTRGINTTEAGYLACVSRTQASRVARKLAARGLLSLRGTPSDRRLVLLVPTEEGREVAERLSFLLQHRMYGTLRALSEDELRSFGESLLVLRDAVAALEPPRRRRRAALTSPDTAREWAPAPSPRSRGSSPPTSARRRPGAGRS